jgi:hypothetical protein
MDKQPIETTARQEREPQQSIILLSSIRSALLCSERPSAVLERKYRKPELANHAQYRGMLAPEIGKSRA